MFLKKIFLSLFLVIFSTQCLNAAQYFKYSKKLNFFLSNENQKFFLLKKLQGMIDGRTAYEHIFVDTKDNLINNLIEVKVGHHFYALEANHVKNDSVCNLKKVIYLGKKRSGTKYHCWYVKVFDYFNDFNAFERNYETPYDGTRFFSMSFMRNYLKKTKNDDTIFFKTSHNYFNGSQHLTINYLYNLTNFKNLSKNDVNNLKNNIVSKDTKNLLKKLYEQNQFLFEKTVSSDKKLSLVDKFYKLENNKNSFDNLNILKEMYENKLITKKEFLKLKKDILK